MANAQMHQTDNVTISISPKVIEKPFTVPAIPQPFPTIPVYKFETYDGRVAAATRLHLAANEVRLLEVWSLDPDPTVSENDASTQSRLYPFHGFRTVGREDLKAKADRQHLLNAVILSITSGPDEAYECFEPRHGLRIHTQKSFIDVVLCYECLQGVIYEGEAIISFTTTRDAERVFDGIFSKLGLRKTESLSRK